MSGIEASIRHFSVLEEATAFLREGVGAGASAAEGARVLGFFSSADSIEQTVFLTVSTKLAEAGGAQLPALGRATVGRGSRGCTVYAVPAARVLLPNGSFISPLLAHRFWLPESPADKEALQERWTALARRRSAPPSPRAMWEEVLEREAMSLHRFLSAASLQSTTELSASTLAPLLDGARALGVLVMPPSLSRAHRRYQLRQLRAAAEQSSQVRLPLCVRGPLVFWRSM